MTLENPMNPEEKVRALTSTWGTDDQVDEDRRQNAGTEEVDFERGQAIGRYLILHTLGSGGMGRVFAAYDTQLDRRVALKVLLAEGDDSKNRQSRLLREAHALARINHPNVITLYDAATFEGRVVLAMELVAGRNLAQWLEDGERSQEEILDVFRRAGQGLAAAHAAGLVHRDFKPGNVMVGDDDRVLVLDFGLARVEESEDFADQQTWTLEQLGSGATDATGPLDSALTRTGSIMGTPRFMAPEQQSGGPVDARADQFSFCVALYWALCGRLPAMTPAIREAAKAVLAVDDGPPITVDPEPVSYADPEAMTDLSVELQNLLGRGLSVLPEDRFSSMDDVLTAMDREPGGGPWRWSALAALLALLSVGYLIAKGEMDRTAGCPPGDRHFESFWGPEHQQGLGSSLLETGRPYARTTWPTVRDGINDFRRRWLTLHRETCEATHVRREQSPELLDLRMACLHERRQEVAALVRLLTEDAEQTIEGAAESIHGLTPLELCADTRSLHAKESAPSAPEAKAQVEELSQELAAVQALYAAHQFDRGLAELDSLLPAVEDLGYWPLVADTRFRLGRLQESKGHASAAWRAYEGASWAAQAGGHLRVAAASAVRLVRVAGYLQGRTLEARTFGDAARRQLGRLSRPAVLEAELEDHLGLIHLREGRYEAAAEQHRKAVSLVHSALGKDHPSMAGSLIRLGNALQKAGEISQAEPYLRQALEIHRHHFGSDHPQFASSLERLASNSLLAGHHEEAKASIRQAIEILRRADPNHPELAPMLTNLGIALAGLGEFEEALETYDQALEWYRRQNPTGTEERLALLMLNMGSTRMLVHGPDREARRLLEQSQETLQRLHGDIEHSNLVAIALNLGEWHLENRQPQAAERHYRRALRMSRSLFGERNFSVAAALAGQGRALNERGRFGEAIEMLEPALAIWLEASPDSAAAAETRFELARALWSSQPERSSDLARQAQAFLRRSPVAYQRLLERVEAWREMHPKP